MKHHERGIGSTIWSNPTRPNNKNDVRRDQSPKILVKPPLLLLSVSYYLLLIIFVPFHSSK